MTTETFRHRAIILGFSALHNRFPAHPAALEHAPFDVAPPPLEKAACSRTRQPSVSPWLQSEYFRNKFRFTYQKYVRGWANGWAVQSRTFTSPRPKGPRIIASSLPLPKMPLPALPKSNASPVLPWFKILIPRR